eukprot:12754511-Prorocentrum_lima.AAC.1
MYAPLDETKEDGIALVRPPIHTDKMEDSCTRCAVEVDDIPVWVEMCTQKVEDNKICMHLMMKK